MVSYRLQDLLTADKDFRKNLINSATGFKSVTLIGTESRAGQSNLAIFYRVIHLGADPPLIGVLFRPHVVKRETLENILETGRFTINHITGEVYRKAHHTSARWTTSEFESCGFEKEIIDGFHAPFVKDSPVQIGLTLQEKTDIAANGTHLVIGKIELLRVDDRAIDQGGFIDLELLRVVTSSGLDSYHTTRRLSRLSYAKPDQTPKDIS